METVGKREFCLAFSVPEADRSYLLGTVEEIPFSFSRSKILSYFTRHGCVSQCFPIITHLFLFFLLSTNFQNANDFIMSYTLYVYWEFHFFF